ncbi:DUF4833 domain-containing protein [Stappia indica]|uniref:DUF4833 domain-containing protein n=1 Tax=Stappia indica TaxID=538381 RepID=UPI000830615F|nr:DUF4833 domain-containing protein [Stappia indica]
MTADERAGIQPDQPRTTLAGRSLRLTGLLLATLVALSPAAQAIEGTRITPGSGQKARGSVVTEVATLPVVRPEFPVPSDPGQVFYLQRSSNANTVVYAARFTQDGKLDPREPLVAYWRRFNTTGEQLPLKMIEDSFAFGVRSRATSDPDVFRIHIVSYSERPATLRLVEPGRAELLLPVGGRTMRMAYAYAEVDESGLMPSVREVLVMGHDADSGKPLVERIEIE